MPTSLQQILDRLSADDPYAYDAAELRSAQLAAAQERLDERRRQIAVLDRRARDAGVDRLDSFADLVPLLFAHTTYKSYPDAFVEKGRWDRMNQWLDTLSAERVTGVETAGVGDVDAWMARLHAAGHWIFASSGTSGKCSFLNQTPGDREVTRRMMVMTLRRSHGLVPDRSRPCFLLGPRRGAHRFIDAFRAVGDAFGRPGEVHYLSDEPATAADSNRQGRMRRAIAEGSARPQEIADFEREAAERQARMQESLDKLVDAILAQRHEPMVLMGMWPLHFAIAQAGRARGIPDGEFHPDTCVTVGGGLKGTHLPEDYQEQVRCFYGLEPTRFGHTYGMVEMSTTCPFSHADEGYLVPPWIVPLVLDKSGEALLEPDAHGRVEGRFAFFDLTTEGRWGGLISGDRVELEVSAAGPPVVRSVARYLDLPEGDDKLTCAGTMESYVRGVIDV